ncbi:MAG: lysylphosphatidylglycerol synthase transmembrane domain-containing protein [Bacteroidales bacterium]|nr:lysylphosphatidylglycerol synthase transmembrane domain-containing protein [Bacteroidales bacterium]
MKKRYFSVIKVIFFLGLGIFFIWLFLRNLTPEQKKEIYQSFINANFTWFYLSMLVGIASHVFRSLRWKMLLKPMGYNPKNSNIIMAVFIGYLANLALPRLGEVSKCGALARYEKIPMNKSIGTVVTERAIDLLTLIILFTITIILNFERLNQYVNTRILDPAQQKAESLPNPHILFYIIAGVIIASLVILYRKRKKFQHNYLYIKVRELIRGFFEGLSSLKKMKKPWLFVTYTALIWISYWMMTHIVFYSLSETSSLNLNASLIVLMFGSIGIIVVQGGIGIYPAIVAETLVLYNIAPSPGYAMGWLLWTAQQLMIVAIGSASFALLPVLNQKKQPES